MSISEKDVLTLRDMAIKTFYDTFKDEGEYKESDFETYFEINHNVSQLSSELNCAESFHYFFMVGDLPVGFMKLNIGKAQTEDNSDEYLEIQRLYFYKEYQGSGRGKKMIDHALQKAKDLNKTKIWLGVWEHNQQAMSFYKSCGFEVTGQHEFWTGDTVDIDLIVEREV